MINLSPTLATPSCSSDNKSVIFSGRKILSFRDKNSFVLSGLTRQNCPPTVATPVVPCATTKQMFIFLWQLKVVSSFRQIRRKIRLLPRVCQQRRCDQQTSNRIDSRRLISSSSFAGERPPPSGIPLAPRIPMNQSAYQMPFNSRPSPMTSSLLTDPTAQNWSHASDIDENSFCFILHRLQATRMTPREFSSLKPCQPDANAILAVVANNRTSS